MSFSRRQFMASAAATSLAGLVPQFVQSEIAIGSGTLTTISDGHLVLPGSFIYDTMPQDQLGEILARHKLPRDRVTPECNLALYQDGTNTVLFDVGSGPDFMPSAGQLQDSLDAVGLSPEDVTHVVFTHAHPDHIWGLLDDFDDPLFADAQYFMGGSEWDYWWNPETVETIGNDRAAFAVGAKRRMEVIADQTTLFDDGVEILPGIMAVASPGHTPGHMSFQIQNKALVIGDAIGNAHIAFGHPDWRSGSDQDADLAVKSRQMLLDRAVADQLQLVGFHLPGGGMGRAERDGSAYKFIGGAS